MRATLSLVIGLAAILATVVVSQAQEIHSHGAGGDASRLGTVTFANSGADAAQAPFLRGLALLHSFEYDEAAEAFRAAQAADPAFAMAYWAEAVTYSHLLWGQEDVDAARRALNRLAPSRDARLARAKTAREQAYGAAVEALFADGAQSMRVRGFADAMRGVTGRYPDDIDAAAFTSLALLVRAVCRPLPPDQRQIARNDAVTFAQRVFTADPRHPGGAHYLIHATDDPERAPRGTRRRATLCGNRSGIRTRAPHALAHFRGARSLERYGRVQRASVGGIPCWCNRAQALECRPGLSLADLAAVWIPAIGPLSQVARDDRHGAGSIGQCRSLQRTTPMRAISSGSSSSSTPRRRATGPGRYAMSGAR